MKADLRLADEPKQYDLLNDLAWEYRASYPDSGLYFAEKAYALGKKLRISGLAKSINFMGLCYYHKGDQIAAYEKFQLALETAEKNGDQLQRGHANNNVGRLLMEQGLMERAKAYLLSGRDIFVAIGDSSGWAYSLQSLGAYHSMAMEKTEAGQNYEQAYEIRVAIGAPKETVSALLQLGKFYLSAARIDEAVACFIKADSAGTQLNDPLVQAEARIQLAGCLMQKEDLTRAEEMATAGLQQLRNSQNARLLPEAYLTLGQILLKRGDLEAARKYFRLTLDVAIARSDLNQRLEAYFFLWRVDQKGKRSSADLENYTQYMNLRDSVRMLEARQRESQAHFQIEITKREAAYEVLEAREQRKNVVIGGLSVLIVSAALVVFLLLRTKQRVLRVNHLLEDRNSEIKRINRQLEARKAAIEQHIATLATFSKNRSLAVGNLRHAAQDIVAITARNLQVSQASIWLYDEEQQCIQSIACYNLHTDQFLENTTIQFKDAPAYFAAIKNERIIAASDARTDVHTREFATGYFRKHRIRSLLDVTFFLDGQLKGLLCCEQQHELRYWTAEDKLFASSISDIITLAFRTAQRLEFEKQLKEQKRKIEHVNEDLEERVKERTVELETQNKRLAEYAFINSHLLRAPLSRILGLINLMERDKTLQEAEMIALLRKSGDELDEIIRKISAALHEGKHLSIDQLK